MTKWLIVAIVVLLGIVGIAWNKIDSLNGKLDIAEANIKAYNQQLSNKDNKNVALRLTVAQLESYQDSVLQELNETRESLKIKDKNLKALQKVASTFSKADTITLKDTLYRNPSLAVDTILKDEWYSLRLGLKYPSTIAVKPEFKSDKHIVVYTKKETVNPPKKFFLLRWFQKKHLVLKVDVIEKNPYIVNDCSKFVEIID